MSLSIEVKRVDSGIVTNVSSNKVVWSAGRNVRVRPGEIYKNPGTKLLATVPGSIPVRGIFSFKGHDGVLRTVVCCDNKIFAYSNGFSTQQDITPIPAPNGTSHAWRFAIVGAMLVISNGINPPWKWTAYASAMSPLANAPTRIGTLFVLKNRLGAADITDGGFSYPGRAKISGISKPEFWTIDRTMKADSQDLLDSRGISDAIERIVAVGHVGDRTRVYTERNVYNMDPADIPYHMTFQMAHEGIGIFGRRTVVSLRGVDYIMGQDDFYRITDQGARAFGFNIRNKCFKNVNRDVLASDSAFAFYEYDSHDLFFCVPTGTSLVADTAFIYNLEAKAWSITDVDYSCFTDARQTPDFTGSPTDAGVLPYPVVGTSGGKLLKLDDGNNNNGLAFTGYIETGDIVGSSALLQKVSHAVIPILEDEVTDEPILVQVGARRSLSEKINWSIPMPFTLGINKWAKTVNRGEYFRIRFYTDQLNSPWRLSGYAAFYSEETLRG